MTNSNGQTVEPILEALGQQQREIEVQMRLSYAALPKHAKRRLREAYKKAEFTLAELDAVVAAEELAEAEAMQEQEYAAGEIDYQWSGDPVRAAWNRKLIAQQLGVRGKP